MTKKIQSEVLTRIIAAQEENSQEELYSYEVAAWSTEENTFFVYYKPFTLDDVSHVERMAKGDSAKALAYTMIRKALNEEGGKLFTLKDFHSLLKSCRSNVIVSIVNQMNKDSKDIDYSQE